MGPNAPNGPTAHAASYEDNGGIQVKRTCDASLLSRTPNWANTLPVPRLSTLKLEGADGPESEAKRIRSSRKTDVILGDPRGDFTNAIAAPATSRLFRTMICDNVPASDVRGGVQTPLKFSVSVPVSRFRRLVATVSCALLIIGEPAVLPTLRAADAPPPPGSDVTTTLAQALVWTDKADYAPG